MNILRAILALASLFASHAAADQPPLEALFHAAYANDAPGAAVIVVSEGKVLYRDARGLANLELQVPLRADHVFRIGSVTKQFTAAAILLLAQQGKLSLSDPLGRFLPDYPVQGHVVTVEHLLTHTSGIRNYTELPEWAASLRRDVSVAQLVDFFREQPFDFAPGERWKYDNSGYVLLGAIIEKVSGQGYAQFMRSQIFEPLGMEHTRYDAATPLVAGRVAGYMRDERGWRNADFLSMTHPYAAGALLSTVDDLARWNAAMDSEILLTRASWQRATQSAKLPDARQTRYGMGWITGRVGPVATVEHGGGVLGFNAYVLRAPSRQLYVAVLANASPPSTPPQDLAVKLAASVLAVPLDAPAVRIAPGRLDEYVGRYTVEGGRVRSVERQGDRLVVTESGASPIDLAPIGKDLFESRGSQVRFQFNRARGRIVGVDIEPRILMAERARRE
jgi:CubicO group peptidase (beta-lactamase class C family)